MLHLPTQEKEADQKKKELEAAERELAKKKEEAAQKEEDLKAASERIRGAPVQCPPVIRELGTVVLHVSAHLFQHEGLRVGQLLCVWP